MAAPRVSAHLPLYDPTKSSLAYGNRALPKLNRELQSRDVAVRQQALLLLADVLHKRENLVSSLREGIAKTLRELLKDGDSIVRERSAHALSIIAQHALGRQAFVDLGMIKALAELFSDSEEEVRYRAHLAVEMCARTREGAQATVSEGLVTLCVKKLVEETKLYLKEVILDTLHWCFQVNTSEGLKANTLPILTSLLTPSPSPSSLPPLLPPPSLRAKAARNIFDLSMPYEGKVEGCECGCVGALVGLLGDEEPLVRSQAAAALMSIVVITRGKYCVLQEGSALDHLLPLLSDDNSEAKLNCIKALTLLAETPEGKKELQSSLPKLEVLAQESWNQVISRAAQTAIHVITWTP